jgi:hypothetical protein
MGNPQPPKPFIFVGPSYTSLACNLDAQQSMNLYVETDETGLGKNRAALYGTPGIQLFTAVPLPTSPIRGMLATDAGRLFVIAGSKFYEVYSDGTYSTYTGYNNDVGPDDGLPVYMCTNQGRHIMIVAGGKVWIDDGVSVEQAQYQNGEGTVIASGLNVTWISGSQFDSSNVGNPIVISGTSYTVASVTDTKHLVLTTTAGTIAGTTVTGTVDATGTAVTRVSGTYFNPDYIAETTGPQVCTIAGVEYTIASVESGSALTLVSPGVSAPVTGGAFSVLYGVPYSATKPVLGSFGAYLDGYFIVAAYPSWQINISAPNDGKSWNPADYGLKEGAPDGIVGLLADHEELWIFGSQTIEVWNDTGAAAFPLQRNPSGFIPTGCVALGSPVRVGPSVGWLGSDTRGGPCAYLANGFIPVRISTYPIEAAWAAYSRVDDAKSYSYTDDGHTFWVINFTVANKTWVYDLTEKLWHERGYWNPTGGLLGTGGNEMQRQRYHAFSPAFGHVVSDWQNANLYTMKRTCVSDNGTPIHRIRSAPHIANETLWCYFSRFTLDTQAVGGGWTPFIYLDWSDDGGFTWHAPVQATLRGQSVCWRRLGKSRDRVFRVTFYDPGGQVAWINAHVDYYQGIT